MTYRDLFDDFPQIKFLINNVLESDRLIKNGLLPQPLPKLLLPDNIQDIIFKKSTSSTHKATQKATGSGIATWMPCQNWTGFCVIIATIWKRPMVCGPTSTRLTSRPFQNTCMDGQRLRSWLVMAIFPAACGICGQHRRSLPPTVPIGPRKTRPASIPSPRLSLWMPWPQLKVWQSSRLCHHVMVARQAGN